MKQFIEVDFMLENYCNHKANKKIISKHEIYLRKIICDDWGLWDAITCKF